VAQPADFQKFFSLAFHSLDRVDYHENRVDRGQGAIGIFGKVVMAGGIEKVYFMLPVVELNDRLGNRNAPLLIHFHPVRSCMACRLACPHFAGLLDCTSEQKKLFSNSRLSCIGMADRRVRRRSTSCLQFFHRNYPA
jgi:hypothetical protein